uniref:phospholipase A2 n=1 Tax=Globodera pallida TaxID=36090 RepID=A0A183CDX9_GLOPA
MEFVAQLFNTITGRSDEHVFDNQNLFFGFTRDEMAEEGLAREHLDRKRNGTTALINAVKRTDLDGCLQLLSFGASVFQQDSNNVSPIQHAIAGTSVRIVKLLLCFGADFDLDTSLKCGHNQIRDLVTRLRKRKTTGLVRSGSSSKTANKRSMVECIQAEQQKVSMAFQRNKPDSAQYLRLLSLDGGGVRGLVLIQMLLEIQHLVDGTQKHEKSFVERHFDWISGTSTGAIVALALADKTELLDCLRLYLRLKDEIFGAEAKARLGGYKAENIEVFLQEHFGSRTMNQLKSGVKVFVTATKAKNIPVKLVLFRNYESALSNKSPNDSSVFGAYTNAKTIIVNQVCASDGRIVDADRMLCHLQNAPYFRLTPQLEVDVPLDTIDNCAIVDLLFEAKMHINYRRTGDGPANAHSTLFRIRIQFGKSCMTEQSQGLDQLKCKTLNNYFDFIISLTDQ